LVGHLQPASLSPNHPNFFFCVFANFINSGSAHLSPPRMADEPEDIDMTMSLVLNPDDTITPLSNTDPIIPPQQAQPTHSLPTETQPEANGDPMELTQDTDAQQDHPPIPPPPPPGALNSANLDDTTQNRHNNPESESDSPSNSEENSENSGESEDEEDEAFNAWQPIQEDTHTPSATELFEIDTKTEYNALDHDLWDDNLMKLSWELDYYLPNRKPPTDTIDQNPEYRVADKGKLEWTIDNFNGTKQSPAKELVRKSSIVNIGGYEFQVRFFPRGAVSNDQISLYITCLSFKKSDKPTEDPDIQQTPLPLLFDKKYPKYQSLPVRISAVLYNPAEPRVLINHLGTHRFCSEDYDWGWDRFYGPVHNIGRRPRLQRAPLLQNDTLKLSVYIHVIEDKTGCLWVRPTDEIPYDSFSFTGLQSLMTSEGHLSPAFVPAVSSWLLLKPFRQLLYDIQTRDQDYDHFTKPQPVISALQQIIYRMRTLPRAYANMRSRPSIDIGNLFHALLAAGVRKSLIDCDVVEAWEIMRYQIERELESTPWSDRMEEIFGLSAHKSAIQLQNSVSHASIEFPNCRLRIPAESESIQQGLTNSKSISRDEMYTELPNVLQIEVARQSFDLENNRLNKLLNGVKVNEHVKHGSGDYCLYGIITHRGDLKSKEYWAMLRPNGPGSTWYRFQDRPVNLTEHAARMVEGVTSRVALDCTEGNSNNDFAMPVVYVAMYIRSDQGLDQSAFNAPEPEWRVPEWLTRYIVYHDRYNRKRTLELAIGEKEEEPRESDESVKSEVETEIDVMAIDAQAFVDCNNTTIGIINLWESEDALQKWTVKLTVSQTEDTASICQKLATVLNLSSTTTRIKLLPMKPDTTNHFPRMETYFPPVSPFSLPVQSPSKPLKMKKWLWYRVFEEVNPIAPEPSVAPEPTVDPDQLLVPAPEQAEDTIMNDAEGQIVQDQPPSDTPAIDGAEGQNTQRPETDTSPAGPTFVFLNTIGSPESAVPPPQTLIPPGGILRPTRAEEQLREERVHKRTEVAFFLKTWDPKEQKLTPIGLFWEKESTRIDRAIRAILHISKDQLNGLWAQKSIDHVSSLHRKTFRDESVSSGDVIIAQLSKLGDTLEDEMRRQVVETGGCPTLYEYLLTEALAFDKVGPIRNSNNVTFSYFGKEPYKGPLQNFRPHGEKAQKIYFNGAKYTGSFVSGMRHGTGAMLYPNKDTYEGSFRFDKRHGNGVYMMDHSGNKYEGNWENDKKNGHGITYWKQAEITDKTCKICWGAESMMAFDCGHVVTCEECGQDPSVKSCPLCMNTIHRRLKLFYA
jgi:hypothetical protein